MLLRGHWPRKRKAWWCWWGRSLGSDGCCPCDAPSGMPDWLVPSMSHTHRPPLRGVRGAHIYHWGRAVARPGMGHSSPLHARAHPHTQTHTHIEKTTLALSNLNHVAFSFNNKDWSDDVDIHPPHPITPGGMTSGCPSCIVMQSWHMRICCYYHVTYAQYCVSWF